MNNVNKQVKQAPKKARDMLAFISKSFEYRNKDVILQLYEALVSMQLVIYVQF